MTRSHGRAARLREIENLLYRKPGGIRAVEIAEALGVDRRTIYRDIDLLSDAGVPIWQEGGKFGVIRDQYLATVRLSFNQAVALYIAARLLARHSDEHNPHIIAALNKLVTAFPEPLAAHILRTAEAIQTRPTNPAFVQILETVTSCWAEYRKARIWYRSPHSGEVRERDISPYLIEPSATGGLYVIGHDDRTGELRTFKLERLERAHKLAAGYAIPDSFNPSDYLADAWGIMSGTQLQRVELRFAPGVAPFIRERIWHASQQLIPQADGSVVFIVQVSDYREMRPWIRSWGAEVEVLQPADLRAELAEEARRLAGLYTADPH
jgi:proteasome accessory factor B